MNLTTFALGMSLFQGAMVARNLTLFRPPAEDFDGEAFDSGLSVLIPARNEEGNLENLLVSLVSQRHCRFEVVVLDDNSDDNTWEIASNFAASDDRFRIVVGQS